jgi:hypothetical protein
VGAAAGVAAAAIIALAIAGMQVARPASLMPTDQYAVYHGEGSERGVRARMQRLDAEEAAVTGRPLSIDNGVPQAQLRDEQAAEREVAEEVIHAACSRSRACGPMMRMRPTRSLARPRSVLLTRVEWGMHLGRLHVARVGAAWLRPNLDETKHHQHDRVCENEDVVRGISNQVLRVSGDHNSKP